MIPRPHSNDLALAPIASESDAESEVGASETASVFVFPATPAQRRFWLLDQMQPGGNPALNMCFALRWRGPLDQSVLRRALNEVVARHEALRTTFESERGQLRQLIAPILVIDLPTLDASNPPGTSSTDLPAHLIREETNYPFDLGSGPLVRGRLVRLTPLEHLLVLTVHHIVSDGWSNGILTRDLCALYVAFLQDRPSPLPHLTIQFADYADWQQARLAGDDFAGAAELLARETRRRPPRTRSSGGSPTVRQPTRFRQYPLARASAGTCPCREGTRSRGECQSVHGFLRDLSGHPLPLHP